MTTEVTVRIRIISLPPKISLGLALYRAFNWCFIKSFFSYSSLNEWDFLDSPICRILLLWVREEMLQPSPALHHSLSTSCRDNSCVVSLLAHILICTASREASSAYFCSLRYKWQRYSWLHFGCEPLPFRKYVFTVISEICYTILSFSEFLCCLYSCVVSTNWLLLLETPRCFWRPCKMCFLVFLKIDFVQLLMLLNGHHLHIFQ